MFACSCGAPGSQRIFDRGHGAQIAVIDHDGIERVLRRECRLRHDHRHGFADVAHRGRRQHGPLGLQDLRAVASRERHQVGKLRVLRRERIGARQDGDDPRMRERRRGVDRNDLRVRAIGAQERRMQLAGQIDVGRIAAAAGD
jgi:hypothetical protein